MAVLGGIVLSALILLICVSIIGRTIGIGPINGDYELVEAGDGRHFYQFFTTQNSTPVIGGHRNFLCCDVNHGGMATPRRYV